MEITALSQVREERVKESRWESPQVRAGSRRWASWFNIHGSELSAMATRWLHRTIWGSHPPRRAPHSREHETRRHLPRARQFLQLYLLPLPHLTDANNSRGDGVAVPLLIFRFACPLRPPPYGGLCLFVSVCARHPRAAPISMPDPVRIIPLRHCKRALLSRLTKAGHGYMMIPHPRGVSAAICGGANAREKCADAPRRGARWSRNCVLKV